MSMVPLLLHDWWDDVDFSRTSRLLDQQFSSSLVRDEFFPTLSNRPRSSLLSNSYYRPWRSTLARQDSGSTISSDKDKFQVILDVQQFTPNEITVKTSSDSVTIEGKHEEKKDEHGFISRHFIRRYVLPQDHDMDEIVSTLSSDGILTVSIPKRQIKEIRSERVIPITQVGPTKSTVIPIIEEKL